MTTPKNASETIREEGVNVPLAQLLRGRGISARAERRSREGVPDVRVDLKTGDLIILECKWDASASLLENQLDQRLNDFPEAVGMVGVLYPERLKTEEDTQSALEGGDRPPVVASRFTGGTDLRPAGKSRLGSGACRSAPNSTPRIGGSGPGDSGGRDRRIRR